MVGALGTSGPGGGWRIGADEAAAGHLIAQSVNDIAAAVTAKWAKGTGGPAGDECQNLTVFVKRHRATDTEDEDEETWDEGEVAPTLNSFEHTDVRTTVLAIMENLRGEVVMSDVSTTLAGSGGKPGQGYAAVLSFDSTWSGAYDFTEDNEELSPTVKIGSSIGIPSPPAVFIPIQDGREMDTSRQNAVFTTKLHNTGSNQSGKLYEEYTTGLDANSPTPALLGPMAVRRLTPTECERLMSWPDDHTRWRADATEVADSARYRMCGNGVVSNVTAWIGQRMISSAPVR